MNPVSEPFAQLITTPRLILRPLRQDDLDPLHAIFSDPVAMRYWDRPEWDDRERTARLLAAFMRDAPDQHMERAIECDGQFIGRVAMWKRFEVGYILSPAHWGKGYATEALVALIPHLFANFPDADHLTAEVDPRNTGSRLVLKKCGFTCTHVEERNFLYGDSEWCDTAYYMLPRP